MTEAEERAVERFLRIRRSNTAMGKFLRDLISGNAPCGPPCIQAINRFIKEVRKN